MGHEAFVTCATREIQGYSKMEIVCASDLDAYRINRWAKDLS